MRLPIARLTPLSASLLTRTTQLLTLTVLATTLTEADSVVAISGFGIAGACTILADSGLSNYILSRPLADISHKVWLRGTVVHGAYAGAGALLAVTLTWRASDFQAGLGFLVAVILAVSVACDSIARSTRTPLLALGQPARFAASELLLGLTRLPIIAAALALDQVLWLAGMPATSLLAMAVAVRQVSRRLWHEDGAALRVPELVRSLFPIGASSAVSAAYSQAPLLIGSFLMTPTSLASIVIAYRVVQATEVIPSMITQQLLPSLVAGRRRADVRLFTSFTALGLLMGTSIFASLPLWPTIFGSAPISAGAVLLLCLSLALKYQNYLGVAAILAAGRPATRLLVSSFSAVLAVAVFPLAAMTDSPVAVAGATVLCEGVLLMSIFFSLRSVNRR